MKVTNEKILDLFGLKVGDVIKVKFDKYHHTKHCVLEVIKSKQGDILLKNTIEKGFKPLIDISRLVDVEYEKV